MIKRIINKENERIQEIGGSHLVPALEGLKNYMWDSKPCMWNQVAESKV